MAEKASLKNRIMGLFSAFGFGKNDVKEYIENGAIILDVRTKEEYRGGAVNGSWNIPLQTLGNNVEKIRKEGKPVVTCCRSGMRSAQAQNLLKRHGIDVINGGPWQSVAKAIQLE